MQKECFQKEIEFLKSDPKPQLISPLDKQLDLFLDNKDILRSRGRISKSLYFDFTYAIPYS